MIVHTQLVLTNSIYLFLSTFSNVQKQLISYYYYFLRPKIIKY